MITRFTQQSSSRGRSAFVTLLLITLTSSAYAAHNDNPPADVAQAVGIHGGLCIQIGDDGEAVAGPLAKTGRFLVQVLCPDAAAVSETRGLLQAEGRYGLASVDRLPVGNRLPYTENLVNLLVIPDALPASVTWDEIGRVLAPGGVLLASPAACSADQLQAAGLIDTRTVETNRLWIAARKPRPAEMDNWTHPRHSASGNAVSQDTLVEPPRRVRWVVGAQSEVPGIVTDDGRNFYGAALARDSFNGLRLWNRDLLRPGKAGPLAMTRVPGDIPSPIAAGAKLFAVSSGRLLALDAATGETILQYTAAGQPRELLHDAGTLITTDAVSVRGLDVETGQLLWQVEAREPRCAVAGDGYVCLVQGRSQRGEPSELVALDRATGTVQWTRDDLPWLAKLTRCVYYRGMLACEVSSMNNDAQGNSLHLVSVEDGNLIWEREFLPGMNHVRQARAMFVEDRLWILQGGKDADLNRLPIECAALDPRTGETLTTYKAGLTHCFPPVATPRYMFAGELNMTDLLTGEMDASRITKAACSRDHGWVPANGLVYVTPKHCVCWPMLRGYAALASERPEGGVADMTLEEMDFTLAPGNAPVPSADDAGQDSASWPCYRHDAWRSGGTTAAGPSDLTTLWSVDLGDWSAGPITDDWGENPFVKGPITAPVVAGGLAYVARPDAHQVVALDAAAGKERWRYTASGRVDTAPTIHRGLCLFGDKKGWVHCLRADDGRVVWRLRAAPLDEQIVAYGQLESPWPVPGSVLAIDDRVYFASGRQPFADGGIFVFCIDPSDGRIDWIQRHNTVPQQGFYECSALEFDNFDLLHRQGDGVAMSRWVFQRATGEMSLDRWNAFARLDTGGGAAMVPQGCWSYAPRHQRRIGSHTHKRPLVVFRDNRLWGCMQEKHAIYRRDFDLEGGETFDARWMTGWAAGQQARDGKMPWRSYRLAEKAEWLIDVFDKRPAGQPEGQVIAAMVLAADQLWIAGSDGDLRVLSAEDGRQITQRSIPAPLWDGMAIADGRLYLSTADGKLLCLGQ